MSFQTCLTDSFLQGKDTKIFNGDQNKFVQNAFYCTEYTKINT